MAIISLHYPHEQLGRAVSILETSVSLAMGGGPVLGGLLIQAVGWRSIFYVNVPFSAAALVLGARMLPPMRGGGRRETFDFAGATAFAYGLLGITSAADRGWRDRGRRRHPGADAQPGHICGITLAATVYQTSLGANPARLGAGVRSPAEAGAFRSAFHHVFAVAVGISLAGAAISLLRQPPRVGQAAAART